MGDTARLAISLGLSALAAWLLTPVAIRVALRTGFLDRPIAYKSHGRPAPYLGGFAVVLAMIGATVLLAVDLSGLAVLIAGVVAMLAIGTIDDWTQLGVAPRILVQLAVAGLVWVTGHGWNGETLDVLGAVLTIVWVVGIINALNLMDNMDGACGTVAGTSALGIGALATADGNIPLAACAFSLAGSCAGFLFYNLARPSRIFLGDGGSTPLGFVLAFLVMALSGPGPQVQALLALLPLVGLVVFDTSLVVFSRLRRGASVLEGGRDHLTHRIVRLAGSPRRVSLVLAIAQIALWCLVPVLRDLSALQTVLAAVGYCALALLAIAALDGYRRPFPTPRDASDLATAKGTGT